MAKRIGFNPLILLGDNPGGDSVIGGGSVHGGQNTPVVPMRFADWTTSEWAEDYLGDGSFDFGDYCMWWESWNFTYDQWIACGNTPEQWAENFGQP